MRSELTIWAALDRLLTRIKADDERARTCEDEIAQTVETVSTAVDAVRVGIEADRARVSVLGERIAAISDAVSIGEAATRRAEEVFGCIELVDGQIVDLRERVVSLEAARAAAPSAVEFAEIAVSASREASAAANIRLDGLTDRVNAHVDRFTDIEVRLAVAEGAVAGAAESESVAAVGRDLLRLEETVAKNSDLLELAQRVERQVGCFDDHVGRVAEIFGDIARIDGKIVEVRESVGELEARTELLERREDVSPVLCSLSERVEDIDRSFAEARAEQIGQAADIQEAVVNVGGDVRMLFGRVDGIEERNAAAITSLETVIDQERKERGELVEFVDRVSDLVNEVSARSIVDGEARREIAELSRVAIAAGDALQVGLAEVRAEIPDTSELVDQLSRINERLDELEAVGPVLSRLIASVDALPDIEEAIRARVLPTEAKLDEISDRMTSALQALERRFDEAEAARELATRNTAAARADIRNEVASLIQTVAEFREYQDASAEELASSFRGADERLAAEIRVIDGRIAESSQAGDVRHRDVLREIRAIRSSLPKSLMIDSSGVLIAVAGDGSTSAIGQVRGVDGVSITGAEIYDGQLVLRTSAGGVINAGVVFSGNKLNVDEVGEVLAQLGVSSRRIASLLGISRRAAMKLISKQRQEKE